MSDGEDGPAPSPSELVRSLVALLALEEIDTDLYRGLTRLPGPALAAGVTAAAAGGTSAPGRLFGGQVIGQALMAAMRSAPPGLVAHSLHGYFMRPGDETRPIAYRVERDFDGRSFATRRVVARQHGRPILNLAASFHRHEEGFSHQDAMPDVPSPDALPTETALPRAAMLAAGMGAGPPRSSRMRAIELRPVVPWSTIGPQDRSPRMSMWMRAAAPLGDEPDLHRAVLAYATDLVLLVVSLLPHQAEFAGTGVQNASLDHALWLHDGFRADEWLLYDMDSPWAGGGRGLCRGRIFARDGRLVASVAQEGLIRRRVPRAPGPEAGPDGPPA